MSKADDVVEVTDIDDNEEPERQPPGVFGRCLLLITDNSFAQRIKQQKLHSCHPILTPFPLIVSFTFFSLLFFLLGILLIVFSYQVVETRTYRYDNICPLNSRCTIRFEIDEDMEEPVYLYYRLENFYQNHRRYVLSRSNSQLQNEGDVNDYDELETCAPKISVDDEDSSNLVYLPCGLVAWSTFNDTFTLRKDNKKRIKISDDDVAWESDKDQLFEDPGSGTDGVRIPAVPSFEDERFIVWMRTASLPFFMKLYGVIEEDLDKGVYRMEIENRYPVHDFDGKKMFKLTTTVFLGGRNPFLGWGFIIVGCVMFAIAFLALVKQLCFPRKLGDTKYLDWNR